MEGGRGGIEEGSRTGERDKGRRIGDNVRINRT